MFVVFMIWDVDPKFLNFQFHMFFGVPQKIVDADILHVDH